MSYITDIYRFTREISKEANKTQVFPEVSKFNAFYADRFHNKNRVYTAEIAKLAKSDRYNLIYEEHQHYRLTLRGYNLVKGWLFFRPGLIFLLINETKRFLSLVFSVIAIGVSIATLVFTIHKDTTSARMLKPTTNTEQKFINENR